jgi:hypothetical protein
MRAVAAENAGALVELRLAEPKPDALACPASIELLQALLQAAPLLRVLEANFSCYSVEQVRRILRNEAPFRLLRVRTLGAYHLADAAAVRSLAEHALSHVWLTGLYVYRAPLNDLAALDAVVDLALQRRSTYLVLINCALSPASAPALARLLGGAALSTLVLKGEQLLDEPAAVLLGNALRANTTLTDVTFNYVRLFGDGAATAALLGALTAHPSVQKLDISYNDDGGTYAHAPAALAAVGAALGALVAANAPALHELHVHT